MPRNEGDGARRVCTQFCVRARTLRKTPACAAAAVAQRAHLKNTVHYIHDDFFSIQLFSFLSVFS